MRARAHARKPLGALSPNVAAPTGTQKPPRAVHPSVARVIGEHTKPRIVGAAVPAAQDAAPAPHVPAVSPVPPVPPAPLAPPFAAGASALARVAPARDAARDLRLVWPLPSIRRKWRTRPCDLAAHCLGHEGPKSALAQLRR
jgi:hypothetical protein